MKHIIILLIILLNIFLLYTNIQRQNRVNILTNQLTACEQQSVRSSKFFDEVQLPGNLVNNKNTLSLITFFSEQGCSPCVVEEIRFLNDLYIKYQPFIDIYLTDGSDNYLNRFGAAFEYRTVEQVQDLADLNVDNPVSLLIDRNNTVQMMHKSETGNPEKSRLFFERVRSLFEIVYEN